jgi:Domain of unknown function (DUF5134)
MSMTMGIPSGVAWLGAAISAIVGLYCIGRLVVAKPRGRREDYFADLCCAVMGIAMVGMFESRFAFGPRLPWEIFFAASAVWFLFSASPTGRGVNRHVVHHLCHATMSAAMVYMYWIGMPMTATASSSSGGSMGGSMSMASTKVHPGGAAILTLALVVLLILFSVLEIDRASRRVALCLCGPECRCGCEGEAQALAPVTARISYAAMCAVMALMLIAALPS